MESGGNWNSFVSNAYILKPMYKLKIDISFLDTLENPLLKWCFLNKYIYILIQSSNHSYFFYTSHQTQASNKIFFSISLITKFLCHCCQKCASIIFYNITAMVLKDKIIKDFLLFHHSYFVWMMILVIGCVILPWHNDIKKFIILSLRAIAVILKNDRCKFLTAVT